MTRRELLEDRQPTVTYGRRPTLGEVRAYYCRDDFLGLLLEVCQTRRVVIVVPRQKYWTPDWDSDRVVGASRAELRQFILTRIGQHLGGLGETDLPEFFPSFHVAMEYWRPGRVDTDPNLGTDAVVEADLPTWHESFQDVMAWITTLRQAHVVHRYKFSGHRSLHLIVPSGGDRLPVSLLAGANAHGGGILRLPYSLNEDTGLVSLPLSWERLHTFRPWQANLHLVAVRDDWLRPVSDAERERTSRFLDSLEGTTITRPRVPYEPAEHLDDLHTWVFRHLEADTGGTAPACPRSTEFAPTAAWQRLCGIRPVTAKHVHSALDHGDPDVRWLTVEAFLLHGADLPEPLAVQLMADDDSYVRSAAVDTLVARFATRATPWLFDRLTTDNLDGWTAIAAALAHSARLRDELAATLVGRIDQRIPSAAAANALGRLATVIGVACEDWPAAWSLVRRAELAGQESPEWAVRRRAVALIDELLDHGRRRSQTRVAAKLASLGPAVTDLLLLELLASEPRTSRALLIALSLAADEPAIPTFIRCLADTHRDRARWASHALVQLGERALPALLEAALDGHPRRRRYAIRCLGHLADPRSRQVIRDALESDDRAVCHQATIAIRPVVRAEDAGLLQQVVRDRVWYTRREAVETLAALGAHGRDAIEELALSDCEPTAAGWLWRHGDSSALPIVLDALRGGPESRRAAVRQLADGPLDDRLADLVIDHVLALDLDEECDSQEPDCWGSPAAEARGPSSVPLDFFVRFRHRPSAFALFGKLCDSEDGWDHYLAAHTLGRWTGADQGRAVALLVSMLHDHQRRDARNALVALGPECLPAVRAARDAASDPASRQRLEAAVNDLEVCRQAETGRDITPMFLAAASRTTARARDRVAAAFREQDTAAVLSSLASSLVHDRENVRLGGRDLLGRMGEAGRRAIARARDDAPQGTAREEMDRFLAKRVRERMRLAGTASRPQ
jgi:HEAT repeat protein